LTCRDEGQAILLISERLEEVFKLSDRIHVLFDGELVKEFPPDPGLRDEVGLAMAGEVDPDD
jgi:simple sugar transport system ATP-binding protein